MTSDRQACERRAHHPPLRSGSCRHSRRTRWEGWPGRRRSQSLRWTQQHESFPEIASGAGPHGRRARQAWPAHCCLWISSGKCGTPIASALLTLGQRGPRLHSHQRGSQAHQRCAAVQARRLLLLRRRPHHHCRRPPGGAGACAERLARRAQLRGCRARHWGLPVLHRCGGVSGVGECKRQAPRSCAISNRLGVREAMRRGAALDAHLSAQPPEMAAAAA